MFQHSRPYSTASSHLRKAVYVGTWRRSWPSMTWASSLYWSSWKASTCPSWMSLYHFLGTSLWLTPVGANCSSIQIWVFVRLVARRSWESIDLYKQYLVGRTQQIAPILTNGRWCSLDGREKENQRRQLDGWNSIRDRESMIVGNICSLIMHCYRYQPERS